MCESWKKVKVDQLSNHKDKSIAQLRAIKIIEELSDSQLEGFCKLMGTCSEEAK